MTEQHGPDRFLLQQFHFTNTSAHSVLLCLKELSDDQSALLTEKIGIKQVNSTTYNDEQVLQLIGMPIKDLKKHMKNLQATMKQL